MSANPRGRAEETVPVPLFGYFCVERDGMETILVEGDPTTCWRFPISTEFDPCAQTAAEAINAAVTAFCEQSGLFGRAELLASQLELPSIRRVFLGPSPVASGVAPEGTQGVFFKIKLKECYSDPAPGYTWGPKGELFASRDQCGNALQLAAISRDFVYDQYGFRVLECVDILVYRTKGDDVEFLMLKREDPIQALVGWEYPKGGILFHETIREGALHRLREETGVTSYEYRGYLGYQVVDVSERRLARYDTLRVHGLTFLFTGEEAAIRPADRREILRKPTWMSWEEARQRVWMRAYGPEFFDRWQANWDEILTGDPWCVQVELG